MNMNDKDPLNLVMNCDYDCSEQDFMLPGG